MNIETVVSYLTASIGVSVGLIGIILNIMVIGAVGATICLVSLGMLIILFIQMNKNNYE